MEKKILFVKNIINHTIKLICRSKWISFRRFLHFFIHECTEHVYLLRKWKLILCVAVQVGKYSTNLLLLTHCWIDLHSWSIINIVFSSLYWYYCVLVCQGLFFDEAYGFYPGQVLIGPAKVFSNVQWLSGVKPVLSRKCKFRVVVEEVRWK